TAGGRRPAPPGYTPLAPAEDASEREMTRQSGLSVRLMKRPSDQAAEHRREIVWVEVRADIASGKPASALATAIASSDMGAVSLARYRDEWDFPNLDIAVHFHRSPLAGWLRVESEPMMLGAGVCVIDHLIFDGAGPCARAHQTLLFSRRRRGGA